MGARIACMTEDEKASRHRNHSTGGTGKVVCRSDGFPAAVGWIRKCGGFIGGDDLAVNGVAGTVLRALHSSGNAAAT